MTRLFIRHVTTYRFSDPKHSGGLQQVRKLPKSGNGQLVHRWETMISGGHVELVFDDHHNNRVELLSFDGDAEELVITSEGEVEVEDQAGVVGPQRAATPLWLYTRPTEMTRAGAGTRALLKGVEGETPLDTLHSLNRATAAAVRYEIGASEPSWAAEDALKAGKGVCQDHAHVFIAAARELGFAARYVSGYLMLNDRTDQDAMHAWAEAHIDGLGWVGFDPSNGISPDTRYVRVATGLDYRDAAPVRGVRHGHASEALTVQIEVAEQSQ
ncbi:MAG: transglutaminase family protein [Pseudomonadota bacterium]